MPDPTDHDVPCLWETGRSVTLHFGAEAVQSQMSKDAPNRLEFEYTRLMTAFLPFHPEPADILIVGLGGGSLSKFCHHHLPDSRITTVEINPEVIALRDTFLIPPESPRFRIICADAVDYLPQQPASTDILLLDGYNADGLPPALSSESFYEDCFQALRPGGLLVANLWKTDPAFRLYTGRLGRLFNRRLVRSGCDTGNEVVLCFRDEVLPPFEAVWQRAQEFQAKTGLNLPQYLENLVFNAGSAWFYGGG